MPFSSTAPFPAPGCETPVQYKIQLLHREPGWQPVLSIPSGGSQG